MAAGGGRGEEPFRVYCTTVKIPQNIQKLFLRKITPFWKAILKEHNFNAVQFQCVEIIPVWPESKAK